jgi:hypothetical protein
MATDGHRSSDGPALLALLPGVGVAVVHAHADGNLHPAMKVGPADGACGKSNLVRGFFQLLVPLDDELRAAGASLVVGHDYLGIISGSISATTGDVVAGVALGVVESVRDLVLLVVRKDHLHGHSIGEIGMA